MRESRAIARMPSLSSLSIGIGTNLFKPSYTCTHTERERVKCVNVQVFPKIYSADYYEKEENGKSVCGEKEGDATAQRADYKRRTIYIFLFSLSHIPAHFLHCQFQSFSHFTRHFLLGGGGGWQNETK